MQYLSQNGYHAISLNDVTAWMAGRKHLPSKSVLITFDDGYKSNYEKAYPILKKYGFVATIFLVADLLDTNGRLSTHQVREMIQNGFSVGSHGLTHKPVIHMGKPSKDKQIGGSKLELEKKLDGNIEYFVYPYGYFDQQTKKDVAESGYVGAFTVIPGKNNQKTHPFELKRLLVTQNIDMEAFRELIAGDLNRLAQLWQKEIPEYMLRGLYRPAEIEARALINVDNKNKVAQKALQILKDRNYP